MARLRISAQYRVRTPQNRQDICRRFWLASFLRGLWLVQFELSVDRPNTTNSSRQAEDWACDSVERDLGVSLNNRGFSCSLFAQFSLHGQCMEYSTHWRSNVFFFFFAALSLTFRGYEAGLFHAYWVISYCGLCFAECFPTGCDHGYSFFYLCWSLVAK